MKNKLVSLLLALALLCSMAAFGAAEEEADGPEKYLGNPMPDFTVTTITGETFTLSEALKTKKAVLVNLWATWCGPCRMEFPYMEQAYEAYKDDVEIIALSVEETDTTEKMQAFAEENGMTFLVASDTGVGLGDIFVTEGIPTTVLVDRFGNVVLIEVGSQTRVEAFTGAFDALISDDYTETTVMDGFPRSKPAVSGSAEGMLAEVLGLNFYVASSRDEYAWPFVIANDDGKNCVAASNAGQNESYAELLVCINAKEGEVFTFNAKINTEEMYDKFTVSLNGEKVKAFSGEKDWFSYAVALQEGFNEISLTYTKDEMDDVDDPDECVLLDDFALVSGEEAAAALAANPVYNYISETSYIELLNESAREIVFEGATDVLNEVFPEETKYYILNDEAILFTAAIGVGIDPEDAYAYSNCDGSLWTAYDLTGESFEAAVDKMDETGYPYTSISLQSNETLFGNITVMVDEPNANAFEQLLQESGIDVTWKYADGSERETDEIALEADAEAEELPETVVYTAIFTDQNGDAVPGCVINFCTDEACTPVFSDENGIATFEGAPYEYHLQVIKVPQGYSFDTTQEFIAPLLGGELEYTVNKD